MKRSVGNGASGSNWSIPNGAKYGLGEGKQPTRMDRKVPKGASGQNFTVKGGPSKSSRKDTGANSAVGSQSYGVGGVSGGSSGGYGGS
tara:strand:- start:10938 stop:11201 length:264 start_codon:yes stop_codon:yes gene_type:complete